MMTKKMMPALKDGTGQWGKMVHPGSRVVVGGVKPRVRDGVGAPAEEEQCGGRSQVELSLRAENREVFIFPELPGLRCTSGNAICQSGCGLQTPAVSLPSSSQVLEVGAQEQEVLVDLQNRVIEPSILEQRKGEAICQLLIDLGVEGVENAVVE